MNQNQINHKLWINSSRKMKFEMFTEVKLKQDIPEYNLVKDTTGIIVDYLPRETGEDGYVLEILDENGNRHLQKSISFICKAFWAILALRSQSPEILNFRLKSLLMQFQKKSKRFLN